MLNDNTRMQSWRWEILQDKGAGFFHKQMALKINGKEGDGTIIDSKGLKRYINIDQMWILFESI